MNEGREIVGIFFADGLSFNLPVNTKIIERDLIFNDVGGKKVNLKVNLKSDSPQSIEFVKLMNLVRLRLENSRR